MANEVSTPSKKNSKTKKYFINIAIVLTMAVLVGYLTLKDNFGDVASALSQADVRYIVFILIAMFLYYLVDGVIIFILARLYTTHYKVHRGLAVAFIGQFYSDITPSSSGGQIAQANTMRKQKVEVSTAASILVMHFIIFQVVLMLFGILAMILKFKTLILTSQPIVVFNISLPIWVLALIGFIINAAVISGLLIMSYSSKIHNFVINTGVNLAWRLHLVRSPEKTRARLQVTTENFRIELRRLQSNIPVTILITIIFAIRFLIIYSIPYLVGLTLKVDMTGQYWNSVFMYSFLQMITSLVPLPGAAGISEYMFQQLFIGIFQTKALVASAQILWRFFTFYFGLIIGGFVSAFYHSRMENEEDYAFASKTFVDIQRETFEARKASSDFMYRTSSLSTREVEDKIKKFKTNVFSRKEKDDEEKDHNKKP
ncbi:MAG TPA: lysylphosphatidylglycerol synthase transmembrane domain-containing protein [Bacilli bacterium]|nr:lysylphosphatidylglycerol synthase transmembrane domain-containing protein [Bacilli bacterium]